MSMIRSVFDNFTASYASEAIPAKVILSVLLAVLLLSAYEFAVYRLVSHRAFYNKAFNISITVIPMFIATIILCLQSNLVITLGTIGALAIIRYRTAVKDPVDMVYILWSIHTGIVCGSRLFEVAVLTSLAATIVLLILENAAFRNRPQVLVVHAQEEAEKDILSALEGCAGKHRIKSRCSSKSGMDYVIELSVKDPEKLTARLNALPGIQRFSLIEYDAQDIL